ncbi:MAG: hypothetical protein KC457_03770, partial [Myxococcales bacterium]|nr:hypothetical protein [Myxococcales bacterium]
QAHQRDQALVQEGLSAACQAVFAQTPANAEPVRLVLAGLNGELRSAKEWSLALLRGRGRFAEPLRLEHPAANIGDAGAGLAPLMMATAALRLRAGIVPSPALVWACSDDGLRGAALLYAGS